MSVRLMALVFAHDMQDLSIQKSGEYKTIKAATAKFILLALADHASDEGEGAYPSIFRLMRKTSLRGQATVVDGLDALQANGYIEYQGRSKRNTADYTIDVHKLVISASEISAQSEISPSEIPSEQDISVSETTDISASENESSLQPSLDIDSKHKHILGEILEQWGVEFPDKAQPKITTTKYRSLAEKRIKDKGFATNWKRAMTKASKNRGLLAKGWFDLEFFLRNDENYLKILNGKYDFLHEEEKANPTIKGFDANTKREAAEREVRRLKK